MHAAYETFLYDNFPFEDTHPDWLGFVGHLFGMDPPPATGCRVLELGCGLGGNLIASAALLPDSEFVGVDLAQAQIARARADAAALGLKNVRFEALDVQALPASLGAFDFITCHGVYSWVAPPVQAAILDVVARHLSPQGVAYISFNTLPGWHARGMLRDMVRRVVKPGPPPQMAADARRFFEFLQRHAPRHQRLPRWIAEELSILEPLSDRYLYFEYLVEENFPVYFSDFVADLGPRGLAYLGDAELGSMLPERFGAEAAEAVHAWAEDLVEVEQLCDYLGGRYFRRALVCRGGVALERAIDGARLQGCWLAAWFEPNQDPQAVPLADGVEAAFTGSDGFVLSTTDGVLKALLLCLHAVQPAGLGVEALVAAVARRLGIAADAGLAERVLDLALELLLHGRLAAGRWPRPIARRLPERPEAFGLARAQCARPDFDFAVTSLRHESLAVDKLDRAVLLALDGRRDRDAVVAAVAADIAAGVLTVTFEDAPLTGGPLLGELVDLKLRSLLKRALVLDSAPG